MARNNIPRLTPEQIEKMTAHQLADLLANVVLVLRRMPDVPLVEMEPVRNYESSQITKHGRQEREAANETAQASDTENLPDWVN